MSLSKPEKRKNLNENGNYWQKKHRTYSEIYGIAIVGWERGIICVFFLLYVVIFIASCVITAALKTDA